MTLIGRFIASFRNGRKLNLSKSIPSGFAGKGIVVAEGDSWFNLPGFLNRHAIADRMKKNRIFRVKNIAYWGDTLLGDSGILEKKEYMDKIDSKKTDFFILSAGGNDLQEGLKAGKYVANYEPTRPIEDYLTKEGRSAIQKIGVGYKTLLSEVTGAFGRVYVICYGYDYPRPLVENGKYIGRYLRKKGIPDQLMKPVMVVVLDEFNRVIAEVAKEFPTNRVMYLRCLNATDAFTWDDDMHPSNDGFRALTDRFEKAMLGL